MSEEDDTIDGKVMECTRAVWVTAVNERASIHADRLKESLNYWNQYKADVKRHGLERIRYYYNTETGDFFYEVCEDRSSLQKFIDDQFGLKSWYDREE